MSSAEITSYKPTFPIRGLPTIRQVDLRSVRHYGVSWMLSGFRLAQLPYAIGLRSHGVESYICFDDKLSLTHER